MNTRLTVADTQQNRTAVRAFLRTHTTDAAGIAAALCMPIEDVSAALVSLDARGEVRWSQSCGWEAIA